MHLLVVQSFSVPWQQRYVHNLYTMYHNGHLKPILVLQRGNHIQRILKQRNNCSKVVTTTTLLADEN